MQGMMRINEKLTKMRRLLAAAVVVMMFPLSVLAQIECQDTCTHVHGIDVSHYQKDIFWEAVGDNSKMAYVYIKCTEGGDYVDKTYAENIKLAHRHGLKVGAYHFWRPLVDQQLQVDNFLAQCRPADQDLIPMIDVEVKDKRISTEAFCDSLAKFLFIIENSIKQKPLVYTGRYFYNDYLQGKLDGYKIMIAQYSSVEPVLADGRDVTMWQYTSKGRINGINGYVDESRFMGNHSLRELRWRRK